MVEDSNALSFRPKPPEEAGSAWLPVDGAPGLPAASVPHGKIKRQRPGRMLGILALVLLAINASVFGASPWFGASGDVVVFSAEAESASAPVWALAVADGATGQVGVAYPVELRVVPAGSGQVLLAAGTVVGMDTQESLVTAAAVAAKRVGVPFESFDYVATFDPAAGSVSGASAGSQFALGFYVALWNLLYPENRIRVVEGYAGTGTIDAEGTIGPVGGVAAKAEAASNHGVTIFAYPSGQEVTETESTGFRGRGRLVTVVVDMTEDCSNLALECTVVGDFDDLRKVATEFA